MSDTKVIDGKQIAADLRLETKDRVSDFQTKYNKVPTLAVVLVGEDPASQVYVNTKTKMAKEIGMDVEDHFLEKSVSEKELLSLIDQLNKNEKVNGILVQLPLPEHMDSRLIIDAIDPIKDADGFHAINVGRNSIGGDLLKKTFTPCTPLGCFFPGLGARAVARLHQGQVAVPFVKLSGSIPRWFIWPF